MNVARLPKAISLAWTWVVARRHVTNKQYDKALRAIDSISPSERNRLDWRLLEFQQHQFLGHDTWVIAAESALVDAVNSSTSLNSTDQAYLSLYVKWLSAYSRMRLLGPGNAFDDSPFRALASSIDLHAVKKDYRVAFPLAVHPKWNGNAAS
jgi:hypothetical protein